MKKFLVAIDQGTTSTRSILFDNKGNILFTSQFEFKQYFPKNGWVEHDPNEIWLTTLKSLKKVISKASKLKGKILSSEFYDLHILPRIQTDFKIVLKGANVIKFSNDTLI